MEQQELTATHRYIICIAGALLPSVMDAYRVSLTLVPIQLQDGQSYQIYVYGVTVRLLILIASAILYCYFFADGENNKARLFFDGMAAPSMLLTLTMPLTEANNLFGL